VNTHLCIHAIILDCKRAICKMRDWVARLGFGDITLVVLLLLATFIL